MFTNQLQKTEKTGRKIIYRTRGHSGGPIA